MKYPVLRQLPLLLGVALAQPALAQPTPPDAGQIQRQELAPQLQPPRPGAPVEVQAPADGLTLPGGAQVRLQGLRFGGNTVFDEAQLRAVLGDALGQSYDLAGLRALAERISAHYRVNGYPFARAILPPQPLTDGQLLIEIVEGRYAQVRALSDEAGLAATAQPWLGWLVKGEVIESAQLERTTLVLDDQPGIRIAPIIRPGQEVGTGDLDVRVERTPGLGGDVGFDNHGNRFTGAQRLRLNLQWDSPFAFGDQFSARLLHSNESMWLGSLSYSLPLGYSGLRGNIGYAHTYYELGQEFASLQASGTAKTSSVGLSYPLLRSQRTNLSAALTWQHKRLNDRQQQAGLDDHKSSDSLPLSLNFDHRDQFGGGAITYGSVGVTAGRLRLGTALATQDRASGQHTAGSFHKWNLDVARVQATSVPGLTLFGRISRQWASKNLDSSEGFGVGGASGVRAYPQGEASGDEGWLAQFEVRYSLGAFSPYAFYDAGRVRINAQPESLAVAPNPNHRAIEGAGLGVRYQQGPWNLDASLAWRTHGGLAQSDSRQRNPRMWVTAGYRF